MRARLGTWFVVTLLALTGCTSPSQQSPSGTEQDPADSVHARRARGLVYLLPGAGTTVVRGSVSDQRTAAFRVLAGVPLGNLWEMVATLKADRIVTPLPDCDDGQGRRPSDCIALGEGLDATVDPDGSIRWQMAGLEFVAATYAGDLHRHAGSLRALVRTIRVRRDGDLNSVRVRDPSVLASAVVTQTGSAVAILRGPQNLRVTMSISAAASRTDPRLWLDVSQRVREAVSRGAMAWFTDSDKDGPAQFAWLEHPDVVVVLTAEADLETLAGIAEGLRTVSEERWRRRVRPS